MSEGLNVKSSYEIQQDGTRSFSVTTWRPNGCRIHTKRLIQVEDNAWPRTCNVIWHGVGPRSRCRYWLEKLSNNKLRWTSNRAPTIVWDRLPAEQPTEPPTTEPRVEPEQEPELLEDPWIISASKMGLHMLHLPVAMVAEQTGALSSAAAEFVPGQLTHKCRPVVRAWSDAQLTAT